MRTGLGLLVALLLQALLPLSASADSYAPEAWTDCTAAEAGGGWGAGGYDDAGRLYIACGSAPIRVYDSAGGRLADIPHGAGVISDVAPSASGSHLYLARGSAAPRRMTRQGNGSYVLDGTATWALGTYPSPYGGSPGGQSNPMGHSIEVDADGNVYLADGSWVNHGPDGSWEQNHNTIVKYSAAGAYLTRFGQKVAGSWVLGDFHEAVHGIAVEPDGSSVYAADGLNNRIQRFDRQGDGSYVATWSVGSTAATNPGRTAHCDARMASPYGVALDGAGDVYVLNTTCDQLLKLDSAGDLITAVEWDSAVRPHGFAVAKNGRRVYVQESQKLIRRTDLGPEGPADPEEKKEAQEEKEDDGFACPAAGPGCGDPCPGCGSVTGRLGLSAQPALVRLQPGARRQVRVTITAEGGSVGGVRVCFSAPPPLSGGGCVQVGEVSPGAPAQVSRVLRVKRGARPGKSHLVGIEISGNGATSAEADIRVKVRARGKKAPHRPVSVPGSRKPKAR